MNPTVSIIIRTKNEEKWLGKVLEKIYQQTFKDFEVIIVDSGSTDKTLAIAKKFPVKIYKISPEEFNYAYALNYGIAQSKGKYITILSGHSLPISDTWLEDGLKNFQNPKMAGIDGHFVALPDAPFWAKILSLWVKTGRFGRIMMRYIIQPREHQLTNTNALILRELWEKYPFDESLPMPHQCEDFDWSQEMLARGYTTIRDPNFTVRHSHHLSLRQVIERHRFWAKTLRIIRKRPRPRQSFSKLFN